MSQNNKPAITVLSTLTKDFLVDNQEKLIKIQDGGPALFIKNIFEEENIIYNLIAGPELKVNILVTDKGEFGSIDERIKPNIFPTIIDTDNVLISTLFDEWPLFLTNYKGQIFIDIQGFVRNTGHFGTKRDLFIPLDYKPFCIKGTEEEIAHINKDFISDQKNKRCLIVTKGKEGSQIFYKNNKYSFKPNNIVNSQHTIGAGDTFFASFIAKFLRTLDPEKSGHYATQKVEAFLRKLTN